MYQSDQAKGILPSPYPSIAGAACVQRVSMAFAVAQLAVGVITEMVCIPAGCRVVDLVLDCDDLDTNGAPALTFDVGIMSGAFGVNDNARTCGAEFLQASTAGQTGTTARPTAKGAFRDVATNSDRSIGIKALAGAATAAAGTVGLTVTVVAV